MRKRHSSYQKGFTLVEILVVIVLIALIGGVAVNMLTITLRTDTTSNTSTLVQQNGDYVTGQFSDVIRSAQHFSGVSTSPDVDCTTSSCTTSCIVAASAPTPTPIPYQSVTVIDTNGAVQTFSCSNNTIRLTDYSISSPQPQAIVNPSLAVNNCQIICSQSAPNTPPVIGISFSLTNSTGSFTENKAQQTFQTSVFMRNL